MEMEYDGSRYEQGHGRYKCNIDCSKMRSLLTNVDTTGTSCFLYNSQFVVKIAEERSVNVSEEEDLIYNLFYHLIL